MDIIKTNLGFAALCVQYAREEGIAPIGSPEVFYRRVWYVLEATGLFSMALRSMSSSKQIIKVAVSDVGGELSLNRDMECDKELQKIFDMPKEKLNETLLKHYSKEVPYIKRACAPKSTRVFTDDQVDYFYHELKNCYPDYYSVLLGMGIPEREIEKKIKQKDYQEAIARVRNMMMLKVRAEATAKALAGDNAQITAFLKREEKETGHEEAINDGFSNIKETIVERKPAMPKEEKVEIRKPSDNLAVI